MSDANKSIENDNEATTTGIDKYKKERKSEVEESDAIASAY